MQLAQALGLGPGAVVALVGGGGKTTAMFRLAEELARQQLRVLTTTSTRIFAAQIKLAPAHVTFDPATQSLSSLMPELKAAIARHGHALLIGQADIESGKAFGVEPETIDALAASGDFDVIINEADGSRMRPLKAPAGHEPVIPASTTVVVPVVGLDVAGRPLDERSVHRPERVNQLSGAAPAQTITAETVAAVVGHPQGGLKNVPVQARVVPFLNKAESPAALATGRDVAARLLAVDRIERIIIGAVQAKLPVSEVHSRSAVVVLAAGGSSRFGSAKQLARWEGRTFIERAVETALATTTVQSVIVVLGAEIEHSRRLIKDYPVQIVVNERWAEGQSTSMQAGLAALPDTTGSVVFSLVDLPRITPDVIDRLVERHRQTLAPLVWPEFEGKRGNPVLFDRTLFPELRQISGDTGGRPLIRAYQDRAERVAVPTPAILQDFDRPEALEQARNKQD